MLSTLILVWLTNDHIEINNYSEIPEDLRKKQYKNNFISSSTACYCESFSKDTFGVFRNTGDTGDSDIYCVTFYTEAGGYEKRRDILWKLVKRYIKEGGESKLEKSEWGKKRIWSLTKGRS